MLCSHYHPTRIFALIVHIYHYLIYQKSVVRRKDTAYHPVMALNHHTLRKIGQRIRQARNERKVSQERLAEMSSLSSTYIGRLERGEKQPSLATLVVLSECLQVSPLDLLIDLEVKLGKKLIRARLKKLVDLL